VVWEKPGRLVLVTSALFIFLGWRVRKLKLGKKGRFLGLTEVRWGPHTVDPSVGGQMPGHMLRSKEHFFLITTKYLSEDLEIQWSLFYSIKIFLPS
jgi:hypothetical protein